MNRKIKMLIFVITVILTFGGITIMKHHHRMMCGANKEYNHCGSDNYHKDFGGGHCWFSDKNSECTEKNSECSDKNSECSEKDSIK